MVYVIVNTKDFSNLVLVKADSQIIVRDRLIHKPDEKIIGEFTDREIEALNISKFAVISG